MKINNPTFALKLRNIHDRKKNTAYLSHKDKEVKGVYLEVLNT